MTNLTALIRTARANREARALETYTRTDGKVLVKGESASGYAAADGVEVRVIPVQPRGMSSKWSHRADVYMGGKRLKTEEVAAILKAEAA